MFLKRLHVECFLPSVVSKLLLTAECNGRTKMDDGGENGCDDAMLRDTFAVFTLLVLSSEVGIALGQEFLQKRIPTSISTLGSLMCYVFSLLL